MWILPEAPSPCWSDLREKFYILTITTTTTYKTLIIARGQLGPSRQGSPHPSLLKGITLTHLIHTFPVGHFEITKLPLHQQRNSRMSNNRREKSESTMVKVWLGDSLMSCMNEWMAYLPLESCPESPWSTEERNNVHPKFYNVETHEGCWPTSKTTWC